MMFKEKLNKKLALALAEHGFEEPKGIQLKCIPKINGGSDVIGVGPTGSGKTTTIVISAIQKLTQAFEDAPRALILVPDQERALWMKEQFTALAKGTDLRVVCAFEEGKIDKQSEDIYVGCDIVVGTPKRTLQIYFKNGLNINKLKFFAIDDPEAMIKNACQGEIDRLGQSLPKCQHVVFTSEYTERVEKLISKFIVTPQIIEVEASSN